MRRARLVAVLVVSHWVLDFVTHRPDLRLVLDRVRNAGKVRDLHALDDRVLVSKRGRQPEIAAMRDLDAEDPAEVKAREADLSFVKLEGNIGCIVNGAGLAITGNVNPLAKSPATGSRRTRTSSRWRRIRPQ